MDALSEVFTKFGVVIGPRGHRRWPDELKAMIVTETLEPGATVAGVARKYDLRPNHLSAWRRMARDRKLVLPMSADVDFAPVCVADLEPAPLPAVSEMPMLEVVKGGITIRLDAATPADRIAEIAAAL